ncbi:hypothetical protein BDC45DRAFT_540756 [Circinella umbellata]|nr:hypothetical protein BDC45DRAFT_540756 [Circinella umbellata]
MHIAATTSTAPTVPSGGVSAGVASSGVGVGGGSRGSRGVGGKGDKNNDPMKVDWEFGDTEDMAADKWEGGPWRWISSPPMPTKRSNSRRDGKMHVINEHILLEENNQVESNNIEECSEDDDVIFGSAWKKKSFFFWGGGLQDTIKLASLKSIPRSTQAFQKQQMRVFKKAIEKLRLPYETIQPAEKLFDNEIVWIYHTKQNNIGPDYIKVHRKNFVIIRRMLGVLHMCIDPLFEKTVTKFLTHHGHGVTLYPGEIELECYVNPVTQSRNEWMVD